MIPDSFRLDRDGQVLERHAGTQADRDPLRAGRRHRRGGGAGRAASSSPASTTRSSRSCTSSRGSCEEVYGAGRDIEWAIADGKLYLLQCRAVTTGRGGPADGAARPSSASKRCRSSPISTATRSSRSRACSRSGTSPRARRSSGGLGWRGVLPDRLGRGDGHGPRHRARDPRARRPLRRDRADRRGRALGDGHRRDRPRLSRAHFWEFRPLVSATA